MGVVVVVVVVLCSLTHCVLRAAVAPTAPSVTVVANNANGNALIQCCARRHSQKQARRFIARSF
jgi:hypothetical protein